MDLDHNGTLSPEEIKSAFILLGIEGDSDKVLKYSDTNKDGRIDYDEFCNFVYQTQSEMESVIGKAEFGEETERSQVLEEKDDAEGDKEETKRFEFDEEEENNQQSNEQEFEEDNQQENEQENEQDNQQEVEQNDEDGEMDLSV